MDKTSLGDRMKLYESTTNICLSPRTYTLIRVDGKAFHTFTKNLKKPFDEKLIEAMDATAIKMCENIQGAKFAYVSSDEISVLLTDFDKLTTQAWFNRELRKQLSISASMATAYFNEAFGTKNALFDSRVWTLPYDTEVYNYFLWRQRDASRNSVQMVARSMYSHRECHQKNNSELQEMIHEAGENWDTYPPGQKRGRVIIKKTYSMPSETESEFVQRTKWEVDIDAPIFSKDQNYLSSMIPNQNGDL